VSTSRMSFGGPIPWTGPLASPANIVRCAREVEALGFDFVWGGEYLLYPKTRPVPVPGSMPLDPRHNEMELLTLFSWLAGQTSRLRFQTAMMILAYRSPFVVAKQIATLDALSSGRFVLGVAAGWMQDEFEIYGIPYRRRGRVLDEYLDIIRALFVTGGPFEGDTYAFPESWFEPRPAATPFPVVIGGGPVEPVLRRVARHGTVWNAYGCGLSAIRDALPVLSRMLVAAGREGQTIGVQTFLHINRDPAQGPLSEKDHLVRTVARFRDAGISELCVYMGELGSIADAPPTVAVVLDSAAWFAEEVMPEFH
jgi:probable F420-dependent oxidoreductase